MAKTTTSRLGQTRWSSGTDTVRRLDFDTDAANLENRVAIFGQGLVSARPTAGTQGRIYTVVGESDSKLNGRIYYDDGTVWSGPRFLTDGYAESTANGNSALVVKSFTSPITDIFKVTNSAETVNHLRVTATGVTSNQATVGSSAGVYFGNSSSHDAAASLVSVATDKPTLIIKGVASQTASLISARDSNNATIFSLAPNGSAVFNGGVTANSLTASSTINAVNITATNGLTTKNLISSPLNANSVAATFSSFSSHLNNIVDFKDASGNRIARVNSEGSFVTNARVVIGGGEGNSITPTYSNTTPSLLVNNSYSSATAVKIVGNPAQSGQLLDISNSADVSKFSVDNNGNVIAAGNANLATAVVGPGTTPTQQFNGYIPKLELVTGTELIGYNQFLTVRHSAQDANALSRTLGIQFKLSSEASSTESNKWSGIAARSTLANASSPSLVFFTSGTEAASLDTNNNLIVGGNVQISAPGMFKSQGGLRTHWTLSTDESQSIGLQSNTLYMRSPNFAWFAGGTHNDAQFGPGLNGSLLMSLTSGSDPRLTVNRMDITHTATSASSTPPLNIGNTSANHMSFTERTINAFTSLNDTVGEMFLQNTGGILNLGGSETEVKFPSRMFFVGSNRVYFGSSTFVPGSPQQNDWWFDHTNESIKIRRSDGTWFNVAGTG